LCESCFRVNAPPGQIPSSLLYLLLVRQALYRPIVLGPRQQAVLRRVLSPRKVRLSLLNAEGRKNLLTLLVLSLGCFGT
jgi:hypothetical protein